ncbi:MAG TPA: hypothetical protein VHD33_02870, partial [Legionellaceae bacterium]|nr:hypothetical protein [Legionellaceae bacterium]
TTTTIKRKDVDPEMAQITTDANLMKACQTTINTHKNLLMHAPHWKEQLKLAFNEMIDYLKLSEKYKFKDIKASLLKQKEADISAQPSKKKNEKNEISLETHIKSITKLK